MTAKDTKAWIMYLKELGPWAIALLFFILFVFVFINGDKVEVWKGIIESHFQSKKRQQSSINRRMRGTLLGAMKKMSGGEKEFFPKDIGIKWVDGASETRESFLDGDQVVLKLNRSDNINKTISIAALEISKTGTLTRGKRYMERELATASDYMLARKLLASINNGQPLGFFDEELFFPLYSSNEKFKEYFDKMKQTDENGMFLAIFLNEVSKVARLLFPEPFNDEAKNEITELLVFLYNLCISERGEFRFSKKYIKVDVAFVGKSWRLYSEGHQFYVDKCHDAFSDGVNTVYCLATGRKQKNATSIEESFVEQYPDYVKTCRRTYIHTYQDRQKKNGICIEFDKC